MALCIKNIPFVEKNVDIAKGQKQLTQEYRAINPAQKVPALVIGKIIHYNCVFIGQSLILYTLIWRNFTITLNCAVNRE